MRVPVDLESRSSTDLEGLFFDTALETPENESPMKSIHSNLRHAADDDWSLYRDVIVSRYIEDDMPLNDVIRLMEQQYGFRSTPKVYKTKMGEWGVQKNLTRSQRDAAVRRVEEFVSRHRYPPKVTLNGRPVPISRLRRNRKVNEVRTRRARSQRTNSESPSSNSDTIELNEVLFPVESLHALEISRTTPTPEWLFTPSPKSGDIHKVLRYVSAFTSLCADAYNPPVTYILSPRSDRNIEDDPTASKVAAEFWSSLITTLNELEMQNQQVAFSELDRACQTVCSFMHMPPTSLFRYLVIVLGNKRWSQFTDIRQHVLTYLAHMAAKTLGNMHPVSIVLSEIQKPDMLLSSAELLLKLAVHEVQSRLGPANVETLWFKRSLARILRRQGEAVVAEQLLRTAKKECELATGPYSRQTRICLEGLGQLFMQEGKLEDAEAVLVGLVRKSEKASGGQACQKVALVDTPTDHSTEPDHMVLHAKRSLSFLAQAAREDTVLKDYWFAKEQEMMRQCRIDEKWAMARRRYQEKRFWENGHFKYLTQLKGHVLKLEDQLGSKAGYELTFQVLQ